MMTKFYTANILTDLYDFVVGIGNFLVSLWNLLVNGFSGITNFIKFMLDGVVDTLTLVVQMFDILNNIRSYLPAYAMGFYAIFAAGVAIRLVVEII